MMKKVVGKYVIAVHGYEDTQYGEADYPSSWFVSGRKYTLGKNTEKIKKFNSYEDAKNYIKSRKPAYTKNRSFEILYLTGRWWKNDESLSSFFSLEDKSPEIIDKELINNQIKATGSSLRMYENFVNNLSTRAIQKRKKYEELISTFKKEIKYLELARSKIIKK